VSISISSTKRLKERKLGKHVELNSLFLSEKEQSQRV
jgi:hypothetical protein